MTAAELSCQVLDLRNIHLHENDYWSCWEVNEKEEMGENYKFYFFFNRCVMIVEAMVLHL